jgi:DNA repair protein RecO (recombination protein O)
MKATTQAIVLRRIRWSESSLILTLYSLDLGRISVMAKGALRAKSPFAGRLELFSRVEVTLSRKAGRELDTLTDAAVLDHGAPLRTDPLAFAHSCLLAEWILGVITGAEASHPTFHLLRTVLEQFSAGPPFWPVLCSGVERLLRLSGLGMEVDRCTRCGADASGSLRWSPLSGGVVCSPCARDDESEVPGGFLEFLRKSRSGPLEKARSLNLWKGGFRQSMEIMRDFAEVHLNARLKLKSLSVLEDLENE